MVTTPRRSRSRPRSVVGAILTLVVFGVLIWGAWFTHRRFSEAIEAMDRARVAEREKATPTTMPTTGPANSPATPVEPDGGPLPDVER